MIQKSKFKNILVITDNLFLVERFYQITKRKKIKNISYAISVYSELDKFSKALSCDVTFIDLKISENIKFLNEKFDLIISLHCKQIFPKKLVENTTCINIHPGYNPINRGWYPQVFSILHDLDIGATIHLIDEKLDHGAIIARKRVSKYDFDTSLSLYNRVLNAELELIEENIISIVLNTFKSTSPKSEGNIFFKKDFNQLCNLDLSEKMTLFDAIKKLRALTHGDFKNAYYYDKNGRKVFISLNLNVEDDD